MINLNTKKLNVIFLPAWYPNKFNKVGGVFVREHAKSMQDHVNLAVFHVCGHPYLKKPYYFEEVFEDGILTYRIYYRKFSSIWFKPISVLLYAIIAMVGYIKVIKRFKPHLNHVHVLTRMGLLALVVKFLYGVPYVITEHWTRYLPSRNSYKNIFRKWLTKLVVQKSSGISAVSNDLKSALLAHQLTHQNFPLISNVVDTVSFKPGVSKHSEYTFLHVSGLNDVPKNVSGLLRAFRSLANKLNNVKLIIVGDDDIERPILEEYAKSLRIAPFVSFVGKQYGSALVDQYQKANAFVLFSNFENQPCVLLEAMSCGLPIVSSNVGGISEVVTEEIGILVNAGDEIALTNAMAAVAAGIFSFDSNRIRAKAAANYSYESVAYSIVAFYKKAIQF